jgi:hypothetical protein
MIRGHEGGVMNGHGSREVGGVFFGCLATLALLYSISPAWIEETGGLVFGGGAAISALLLIISDVRQGENPLKSIAIMGVLSTFLIGTVLFVINIMKEAVSAPFGS